MSDSIFALVMIAAALYVWRAAVLTTWRNDRKSAFVRHRDAPAWYPFGTIGCAQRRVIALSGMSVAALAIGATVQAVMAGHAKWVAEHWLVLPVVIIILVAATVVALFAWPKALIPPTFRDDKGAVGEFRRREKSSERGEA